MNAVDAGILVYAHRVDAPQHARARALLRELAEGPEPWAIPWPCIHEFITVVTDPQLWKLPTPMPLALAAVRAWRSSPTLILLSEDDRSFALFEELTAHLDSTRAGLEREHVQSSATRVAALALQHGVNTLFTLARDYSQFPRLRVKNVL